MRNDDAIVWVSLAIAFASVAVLYFFKPEFQDVIIAILAFLVIARVGRAMRRPVDQAWLSWMIPLAFMFKLIGATFRHYTVTVVYNSGDALTYYGFAEEAIHAWRSLQLPVSVGRSQGTRFIEVLTSLVLAPYFPTILGGFIIFATIAFMGQMLFYAAYRRAMPHRRLKLYGWAIFFLPSLFFWPSSIGKESALMLFIGLAVYGATLMFEGKWTASIPLVAVGMGLAAAVRPHVAALVAGALVLSLVFGRMPKIRGGKVARFLLITIALVGLFAMAAAVTARFGVSLNQEEIDEFTAQVENQTEQGGSSFDAEDCDESRSTPGSDGPGLVPSAAQRGAQPPGQTLVLGEHHPPARHDRGAAPDHPQHQARPKISLPRVQHVLYRRVRHRVQLDRQRTESFLASGCR